MAEVVTGRHPSGVRVCEVTHIGRMFKGAHGMKRLLEVGGPEPRGWNSRTTRIAYVERCAI